MNIEKLERINFPVEGVKDAIKKIIKLGETRVGDRNTLLIDPTVLANILVHIRERFPKTYPAFAELFARNYSPPPGHVPPKATKKVRMEDKVFKRINKAQGVVHKVTIDTTPPSTKKPCSTCGKKKDVIVAKPVEPIEPITPVNEPIETEQKDYSTMSANEILKDFSGDVQKMKDFAELVGVDLGRASTALGIARKIAKHLKG